MGSLSVNISKVKRIPPGGLRITPQGNREPELPKRAKILPRPLRGQVEAIARTIDELREILLQGFHGTDNREDRDKELT